MKYYWFYDYYKFTDKWQATVIPGIRTIFMGRWNLSWGWCWVRGYRFWRDRGTRTARLRFGTWRGICGTGRFCSTIILSGCRRVAFALLGLGVVRLTVGKTLF